MRHLLRIFLEILGPPLVGAVSFCSIWYFDLRAHFHFFDLVKVCLFMSYAVGTLPSFIYMLAMELSFCRGWLPTTWRAVGLSSFLGLCAGVAIARPALTTHLNVSGVSPFGTGVLLVGVGLWTGFVMGLLLIRLAHWSERKARPASLQPRVQP